MAKKKGGGAPGETIQSALPKIKFACGGKELSAGMLAAGKIDPEYVAAKRIAGWMLQGGWNLRKAAQTDVPPAQDIVRFATMIAIGLGESGGNEKAIGDGGQSHGWAQIYRPAHPNVSVACAMDGVCAAKQALAISGNGSNFTPWSVFKSGAFCNHLAPAAAATLWAAEVKLKDIAQQTFFVDCADAKGIDSIGCFLKALVGFVAALFNVNTWIRVAAFVAGIVIAFVAVKQGMRAVA